MSSSALEELRAQLRRAHRESGEPSTREIAKRSHGAVSHTTVHQVLKGANLSPWRSIEIVVEALGRQATDFKALWVKARDEQDADRTEVSIITDQAQTTHPYVDDEFAGAIRLAHYYLRQGEPQKTLDVLTRRIEKNAFTLDFDAIAVLERLYIPDSGETRSNYADRVDAAIERTDPDELETVAGCTWIAKRCLGKGRLHLALEFAHRGVEINPRDRGALQVHGEILLALGAYAEAERILLRAHRDGSSVDRRLQTVLKINGSFEKLEELTEQAHLNPTENSWGYPTQHYVDALMLLGKIEEAEVAQREALQRKGAEAGWELSRLAWVLTEQKRTREALQLLKDHEGYENDRGLKVLYANLLMRIGQEEDGAAILEEIFIAKRDQVSSPADQVED